MKISKVVCISLFGLALSVNANAEKSLTELAKDSLTKGINAYHFYKSTPNRIDEFKALINDLSDENINIDKSDEKIVAIVEKIKEITKAIKDSGEDFGEPNYYFINKALGIDEFEKKSEAEFSKNTLNLKDGYVINPTIISNKFYFTDISGKKAMAKIYENSVSLYAEDKYFGIWNLDEPNISGYQTSFTKSYLNDFLDKAKANFTKNFDKSYLDELTLYYSLLVKAINEGQIIQDDEIAKLSKNLSSLTKAQNVDKILQIANTTKAHEAKQKEVAQSLKTKLEGLKDKQGDITLDDMNELNKFLFDNKMSIGYTTKDNTRLSLDGLAKTEGDQQKILTKDEVEKLLFVLKEKEIKELEFSAKTLDEHIAYLGKNKDALDKIIADDEKADLKELAINAFDKNKKIYEYYKNFPTKLDEIKNLVNALDDGELNADKNNEKVSAILAKIGKIKGEVSKLGGDNSFGEFSYEFVDKALGVTADDDKADDDKIEKEFLSKDSTLKSLSFSDANGIGDLYRVYFTHEGKQYIFEIWDNDGFAVQGADGYIIQHGENLEKQGSGLTKDMLLAMLEATKAGFTDRVEKGYKREMLVNYAAVLKAINDNKLDKNDESIIKLVKDSKNFGSLDDMINTIDEFIKEDSQDMQRAKSLLAKLQELKAKETITQDDIAELNKFLLDNKIKIGYKGNQNSRYMNGLKDHSNSNDLTKDDIDKLILSAQSEVEKNKAQDKDTKEILAYFKANKDKLNALLNLKEKEISENRAIKAADEAIKNVENLQKQLKNANADDKKAIEAKLQKAKETQSKALNDKAKSIAENSDNTLAQDQKDILVALGSVAKNEIFATILSGTKDEIIKATKEIANSIDEISKNIGSSVSSEIAKFSSGAGVSNRLAMLSNPNNKELALALAIKNLNGEKFADSGNALASIIRDYERRFSHENGVWANALAALAKSGNVRPKMTGVSVGYDKAFDSSIVGGFVSLSSSKANAELLNAKSKTTQFGIYTKSFIGQSEIDTRFSYGFSSSNLKRTAAGISSEAKAKSNFIDLNLEYGYVFEIGDLAFVKPYFGFGYLNSRNKAFSENGDAPLKFDGTKLSSLNANAGLELRKYAGDGYIYLKPGVSKELYKKASDLKLSYIGSDQIITIPAKNKTSRLFGAIEAGGEMSFNNLSILLNLAYKGSKGESYQSINLGVKYKF